MSNRNLDMTNGAPTRLLLRFALPMLIGNIFQQLYNLADSVIVGRLVGAEALAAVGATGCVTFLFFALCNGISSGGGVITAQAFGAKDDVLVRKSIANTALVMLILPTVIGGIAFFAAPPLLKLLETPAEIIDNALLYTRTMCVGIIFMSLYNFASSMLRALGDSRTPLYFLIFSCILNVGLDLLFVIVFRMSVFGAGIATVIAQFVSALLCLAYAIRRNPYFRIGRDEMHPDRRLIGRIVRLGVPMSLQFALISLSSMALQRVVNGFGAVTVAVFTAINRIEQIIHQPYQSLSAALTTFCGQNYGAGIKKRVVNGYHRGVLLMTCFTLAMIPVVQLFGRDIVSIFVNDTAVIDMGARAIRITSMFYLCLGMIYVIRGVLNGLGDARFALLNGIVEVIGRFSVPLLLTGIDSVGVWGIWWANGIVWFLSGFTAWLRYLQYRKRIGLVSPDSAGV